VTGEEIGPTRPSQQDAFEYPPQAAMWETIRPAITVPAPPSL
jgi:hypothetical protein